MSENTILKDVAFRHKEHILFPYSTMVDMSGFDAIYTFAQEFGGSSIYVPNLRTIFKNCIEKEIATQLKSKNARELAKLYNFSERHIRNLMQNIS